MKYARICASFMSILLRHGSLFFEINLSAIFAFKLNIITSRLRQRFTTQMSIETIKEIIQCSTTSSYSYSIWLPTLRLQLPYKRSYSAESTSACTMKSFGNHSKTSQFRHRKNKENITNKLFSSFQILIHIFLLSQASNARLFLILRVLDSLFSLCLRYVCFSMLFKERQTDSVWQSWVSRCSPPKWGLMKMFGIRSIFTRRLE